MKLHFILLIILFSIGIQQANGQFYYSDILANKVTNENYVSLKNNKIKNIIISNGNQAEDEEKLVKIKQHFSNNWQQLTTQTNLPNGEQRIATTTYLNNKILKKEDEGLNINSLIRFEYDNSEKLTAIRTSSIDTSVSDGFFEKHLFFYGTDGKPTKMYKIKNSTDTTTVIFLKDEQQNIAEEKWMRNNKIIETYYYYYNEKNMLTDIVRFNPKYEKMLPEFLFEYNENNQISQLTQVPYGSGNYTICKYLYNANGLKTTETLFTKKGEMLSKIEYVYEF